MGRGSFFFRSRRRSKRVGDEVRFVPYLPLHFSGRISRSAPLNVEQPSRQAAPGVSTRLPPRKSRRSSAEPALSGTDVPAGAKTPLCPALRDAAPLERMLRGVAETRRSDGAKRRHWLLARTDKTIALFCATLGLGAGRGCMSYSLREDGGRCLREDGTYELEDAAAAFAEANDDEIVPLRALDLQASSRPSRTGRPTIAAWRRCPRAP